jgi:hypothetical protein
MSKPRLDTIISIMVKKDEAIRLLEEVKTESIALVEKYGESRFDYEIEETDGYKYVKYELIDNDAKSSRGETVMMHTVYKPKEIKQTFLKRLPESLKK